MKGGGVTDSCTSKGGGFSLSENSKIKLGLAVTAIAACSSLAVTLYGLRTDVDSMKTNQWTIAQQCETALRTALENPGLRVPDPRNPGGIIVVDKARIIPQPATD